MCARDCGMLLLHMALLWGLAWAAGMGNAAAAPAAVREACPEVLEFGAGLYLRSTRA